MKFEQDLFISYAHIDNEPIPPDKVGWISLFHESLGKIVKMQLGSDVRIWRDDKLTGNDVFSDEIVDQFRNTAILVFILTPGYVNSEWCSREMHEFCDAAEQTLGVVLGNKSRVIKVIKTPVASVQNLPEIAQEVLGYEFYKLDKGEVPFELDPIHGEDAKAYRDGVLRVAWDIKQLLEQLKTPDGSTTPVEKGSLPKVFLAECSYDRKRERQKIESELKVFGHEVVPTMVSPTDEEGHTGRVRDLLEDCGLSIHLIGGSYGAVPDGPSRKSAVVIQNELAAEFSRTKGLRRLIWLPETTQTDDPLQQGFIEALHADENTQYGADLITGDFERFKTAVHSTLKELETAKNPQAKIGDVESSRLVYLICNPADRKATVALRKHLRENGIDVETPAFEGDAEAVRKTNEKLLATCDGVIVFYGSGDEAWKRSVDDDLKKMFAYREGRDLMARFTYLADPPTADKEDLVDMEEPNLISGFGKFDAGGLSEFLEQMDAGEDPS